MSVSNAALRRHEKLQANRAAKIASVHKKLWDLKKDSSLKWHVVIECKVCTDGIIYPLNPEEEASSCYECEGKGAIYMPVTGYATEKDVREDYPSTILVQREDSKDD
tara:strand:- start:161 stop:481 length:321 start_codon:yes stop_codon:yes gene_type:complete